MTPKIFIISGPSGVGKDTILEGLLKQIKNLTRAISYTDRPKRQDDKPNAYHFITKKEFDESIKTDEIFEWEYARDAKSRYGSSKNEVLGQLKEDKNLIKIVGPKSFKKNFKDVFGDKAIGIFIKYENLNLLKERIKKTRPDTSSKDLEIRYRQAFKDMGYAAGYDYVITNKEGEPEQTIGRAKEIIEREQNE